MTSISEQLERMISRHLDGELSSEEELTLSREMLKNPAARDLCDQYRQLDELTSDSLVAALSGQVRVPDVDAAATHERALSRHSFARRSWMLIPGAIAAALLAVAVNRLTVEPVATQIAEHRPTTPQVNPLPAIQRGSGYEQPAGMMRNVSTPIRRATQRDLLGIVGDDGKVYWIEVEKRRTLRNTNQLSQQRPLYEDI